MAWIRTVAPGAASGLLAKTYAEAVNRAGRVFNILRLQSLNPRILDASTRLYLSIMHAPSSLSRAEREMLATVTSRANDCFY